MHRYGWRKYNEGRVYHPPFVFLLQSLRATGGQRPSLGTGLLAPLPVAVVGELFVAGLASIMRREYSRPPGQGDYFADNDVMQVAGNELGDNAPLTRA